MKNLYLGALLLFCFQFSLQAQEKETPKADTPMHSAHERKIPIDTTIITQHSVTINGKPIDYTATTGMQPAWDEKGQPIATLQYTYYTRNLSLIHISEPTR